MKKVKNLFYLLMISIIVLNVNSCTKDERIDNVKEIVLFNDTKYNNDLNSLSVVLSEALNDHNDLRRIVKAEALKKFDGDYDILLKDFKNKSVTDSKSRNSKTVKELLNDYFPNNSNDKSPQDIIDALTDLYPDLQISVPVLADEWDENYIPKVAFIPQEFEEATTIEVAGYQNGEQEIIDAVNPPSLPVVVLGMNERIAQQNIVIDPDGPIVSITLTGITTESGIRLTWTIGTNTGDSIFGYKIYRKKAGDPNFTHIWSNFGISNKTYDDTTVENNKSYSYYIKAMDIDGDMSSASNIINITAPNNPNPVLTFDVEQHALNIVECRWTNDYTEYFDGTELYKWTIGVDSDYYLYQSFDTDTHDYIDNIVNQGKKTIYKAIQTAPTGDSNPKYDFIKAPFRDISIGTPVYVERIECNSNIESWLQGAPEFRLKVISANPSTNSTYTIQDEIILDFFQQLDLNYNNFNNVNITNWHPNVWHDMWSFSLVEHDYNAGSVTINLSAKFKKKNVLKTGFDADGSINYTYTISNSDENCGNSYYRYYDPETMWLTFPNYGAKVLVSKTDVNMAPWQQPSQF